MSTPLSSNSFIQKYKQAAIEASAGTKIFAATILAAAGLESGNGGSFLASKYNNFFGIKADSSWTGKKVILPTKEQDKTGKVFTVNAPFRWYDSPTDSFRNYVHFISGTRYVKAGVLAATTPEEQFAALHKAGYATDISYVEKLTAKLASFGSDISDLIKRIPPAAAAGGLATSIAIFFLQLFF